jgi:hypothetical protein
MSSSPGKSQHLQSSRTVALLLYYVCDKQCRCPEGVIRCARWHGQHEQRHALCEPRSASSARLQFLTKSRWVVDTGRVKAGHNRAYVPVTLPCAPQKILGGMIDASTLRASFSTFILFCSIRWNSFKKGREFKDNSRRRGALH